MNKDSSSPSDEDDDEEEEFLEDIRDEPLEGEEHFNKNTSLKNIAVRSRDSKRMALYLVDQDEVDMYYMFINVVGLLPWQALLLVSQLGYGIISHDSLAGYHFTKSSSSLEAQLKTGKDPGPLKASPTPSGYNRLRLIT